MSILYSLYQWVSEYKAKWDRWAEDRYLTRMLKIMAKEDARKDIEKIMRDADHAAYLKALDREKSRSAVVCQVCKSEVDLHEMRNLLVACRDCSTIHHTQCWKYLGKCSTYSCGCSGYRLFCELEA